MDVIVHKCSSLNRAQDQQVNEGSPKADGLWEISGPCGEEVEGREGKGMKATYMAKTHVAYFPSSLIWTQLAHLCSGRVAYLPACPAGLIRIACQLPCLARQSVAVWHLNQLWHGLRPNAN